MRYKSAMPLHNRGFSLIIMAFMLVMIGGLVVTMLLPQAASLAAKVDATHDKIITIRDAIGTYHTVNNTYPCPASFVLPLSNSGFGVETNSNIATNCKSAAACSGSGLSCPASNSKTWVGAVPVRAIGLSDNYEFDEWGNRFTYAVNNNGSFVVNTYNGATRNMNTYILSHGPDGIGAYNRSGTLKTCAAIGSASLTLSEYQNCNHTSDDIFLYRKWESGTDFYDDISLN